MTEDKANYSQQQELFDPERAGKITLIGAGSVGSFVAYLLDKMGVPEIEIWDGDSVASHNCPMSFYDEEDVGRFKVDVLQQKLRKIRVIPHREMYTGEELRETVVICCVDLMSQRKLIWNRVKMVPTIPLFVDTRTAGWYAEVLSIDPNSHEEIGDYEKLLYDDTKATRQLCGMHGVAVVSMRAAQIAVSNTTAFWHAGLKRQWRVGERVDTHQRAL